MGFESGMLAFVIEPDQPAGFMSLMIDSPFNALLFLVIFSFLMFRFLGKTSNRFNKMRSGFKIFIVVTLIILIYLIFSFTIFIYLCGGEPFGLVGRFLNWMAKLLGIACMAVYL